jgi:hypothetical protein
LARGEVKYRLTLDSNVQKVAEQSAAAMKSASGDIQGSLARTGAAWDEHTSRVGKVAGAVDLVSKKMAGAAESIGLPAGPLRKLSDISDLADVGFSNLTKSAAGFNAASVGVAGAGLAVGTAIGSWLNTFPAVRAQVDKLRDSLLTIAGLQTGDAKMQQALAGMAKFQEENAKSNIEATKKQLEWQTKHGQGTKEAIEYLQGKAAPVLKAGAGYLQEMADKHKKAEEATRKHTAELNDLTKANEALAGQMLAAGTLHGGMGGMAGAFSFGARAFNKADLFGVKGADPIQTLGVGPNFGGLLTKQFGSFAASAGKEFRIEFGQAVEGLGNVILGAIQGGGSVSGAIGAHLGGSMGADLGKIIANNISGSIGKALGSLAGPLGSLLGGGVGSLFGKLFGGLFGSEEKKVNPIRQQFIDAAGGLDALNKKAAEAGLTLNRLLDASTVKEYEAAINELTGAFGLQSQAQNELNAAAEKYGFQTQQQIDMMGGDLLKSWELLTNAQFGNEEVLRRMAPDLNAYFQKVIEGGGLIPQNFQMMAEEMERLGLLTDASGESVETLAEAGVNGFGAMTDQMKSLVDAVHELVNALRQASGLPGIPTNVGGGGGGANVPGGRRGGEELSFAGGSGGFQDFGQGTPARLHGMEAVVTPGDIGSIGDMLAARIGGGGPMTVGGRLEIDLVRGFGDMAARAWQNNEGGFRETVLRDVRG